MSIKLNEKTLIYGVYSIESLICIRPDEIKVLYICDKKNTAKGLEIVLEKAHEYEVEVQKVSTKFLDKITNHHRHQGVAAKTKAFKLKGELALISHLKKLSKTPFLLILENVYDPRNLGACFRSASAAGVDAVIISKRTSSAITPLVHHTSVGATQNLSLFEVANLARIIKILKQHNIWIFGLDARAQKTLYETDLTLGSALIVGVEDKGIKMLTKILCDDLISIPMPGRIESLNISVASAIALFEANRQRLYK